MQQSGILNMIVKVIMKFSFSLILKLEAHNATKI